MRARPTLVAMVFYTVATVPATAQNQLQNSTFESALAPWTGAASAAPDPAATGTALWTSTHNLDNLPGGSGSSDTLLDAAAAQPANASFGIRQCAPLAGAPVTVTEASYNASFLAPATGNPSDGMANATIEVRFFSDASCTTLISGAGGSQGLDLTPAVLSDTQWYTLADPQFVPPGGSIQASSVEVRAFVRTVGTTGNAYRVYFDWIVVSLNGTTPVDLQRFSIE